MQPEVKWLLGPDLQSDQGEQKTVAFPHVQ